MTELDRIAHIALALRARTATAPQIAEWVRGKCQKASFVSPACQPDAPDACPTCCAADLIVAHAALLSASEAARTQAEQELGWLVENFGPWHDDDCPGDDTCECSAKPHHDAINRLLAALSSSTPEAPHD